MFNVLLDRIDEPTSVAYSVGLCHWLGAVISNHIEKQAIGVKNSKIVIDMLPAQPPVFRSEQESKIWQSVKALFETLACADIGIVKSVFVKP